jgi:uncharacterized membrane protein
MNTNWGAWLNGLISAFVGAFATAATGALTMPGVFNFSHNGLINFLKISVTPAIIAFFAYLQQHPIPTETTTLKQTTNSSGATQTEIAQTKTQQ